MKRNLKLIKARTQFIKDYFKQRKEENPDISIKEISIELSDWYLFITPRSILTAYYS